MLRPLAPALALLVLLVAGCDRRVEPWVPADQEPPPAERPVRIPGLERPQPSLQPLQAPAQRGSGSAAPASAPGETLRGTIRLADGAAVAPGSVLFVIARNSAQGPPLAVRRMAPGPFPLEFVVGPADVMIPGRPFAGPISLTARLDADGDPLSRDPADLVAGPLADLEPGGVELDLVLAPASD